MATVIFVSVSVVINNHNTDNLEVTETHDSEVWLHSHVFEFDLSKEGKKKEKKSVPIGR